MSSQNIPKMSLVAQVDDLCRSSKVLTTGCEKEFLTFVESQLNLFRRLRQVEAEVLEVRNKYNALEIEKNRFELQIKHMKDLVAREIEKRRRLDVKKTSMERQISLIKELLMADGNAIDNQTKEKLFFLSTTSFKAQEEESQLRLTTIEESIGSLLSASDVDDTDEDLNPNVSRRRKRRSKGNRQSSHDRSQKKKKTSDVAFEFDETEEEVRMDIEKMPEKKATEIRSSSEPNSTTPMESIRKTHQSDSGQTKNNPYNLRIHSTGTVPSSTPIGRYSTGGKLSRTHAFTLKTVLRIEKCYPCGNTIKFCKHALKCSDCRITCHPECENQCPLPCIPVTFTPTKAITGTIADYTSSTTPMIPSLIVHCINEIESRGLKEIGLYRISGSERDVKDLKDKLLKGRSVTNLNKMDVHAICGTVKEFLRSLKEPLIPRLAWRSFVEAAEKKDNVLGLFDAVCDLPQPNKETLAYLVLHLQKVADSPHCRMPLENLAKVFGPTIVGYSSADPSDSNVLTETRQQCQVMHRLLLLSKDSWESLLNFEQAPEVFSGPEIKTPDLTPIHVASRLGPIYTSAQKQRSAQVGRIPLTPRHSKYSKNGKRFFSPLK